jgi:hypothetical protein
MYSHQERNGRVRERIVSSTALRETEPRDSLGNTPANADVSLNHYTIYLSRKLVIIKGVLV